MRAGPGSIAVLIGAVGLIGACSRTPPADPRPEAHFAPGTVTHVVICYLKQPGDAGARQRIVEASRELARIPGVLNVRVGKVLPSTRPIVVNDYDVGVVITCRDTRAMNEYVKHPIHERAVREVLQPLTAKVVVYDFVNE